MAKKIQKISDRIKSEEECEVLNVVDVTPVQEELLFKVDEEMTKDEFVDKLSCTSLPKEVVKEIVKDLEKAGPDQKYISREILQPKLSLEQALKSLLETFSKKEWFNCCKISEYNRIPCLFLSVNHKVEDNFQVFDNGWMGNNVCIIRKGAGIPLKFCKPK